MKLPKNVSQALKEFVKACKRKFGKNLVSIILFGSYARGNWKDYSDVDLLVIAKGLPKELKRRMDLMDETVVKVLKKHKVRIMPLFYEPEELDAKYPNPLIYGILTGYKVIEGKEFWSRYIGTLRQALRVANPVYVEGEKVWRIKELI